MESSGLFVEEYHEVVELAICKSPPHFPVEIFRIGCADPSRSSEFGFLVGGTFGRHAKTRTDMQGWRSEMQKTGRCKSAADMQGWRLEMPKLAALSPTEMSLKVIRQQNSSTVNGVVDR